MIQQTNLSKFPLLVNKFFSLPKDYVPNDLTNIPNTSFFASTKTASAFLKMQHDAAILNHELDLVSAYRSYDYQATLYEDYLQQDSFELVETYCARAGHSEHQTGCALDVCVKHHELDVFEGTKECLWLHENAHAYGFIIRYPQDATEITGYQYEPWHITYVGKDIATYMLVNQIHTLEEYYFIETLTSCL